MKKVLLSCLVSFGLLLLNTSAMAHGGGGIETDQCVVNIGNYRMHFSAYQPETSGGEELCWDLPMTGSTILVFDLVDRILRDRPVEVRIVEEQKTAAGPSNYNPIVERPVQKYPKGTIELDTDFTKAGEYTAVVILGGDQPMVFKAPLRVGLQGEQTVQWIASIAGGALILGLIFWYSRRGGKEAKAS
ncbi:hypothetical protein [Nitrosococcus oceani]|uniref:Uncharacterized protein n=2 Tax=Nitrosococcus oceani TaxID=1229 RepID=Q3J893_NITOC|nr:hypothetical protein [Nitrosococcus oceani]KFI18752.1 hypothetical protein IB75_13290 [Nitrosococcus oceani C-27]ABA58953.1 conserved hypothetical protein [Nitrosococcus oceani ATCC 19707]EDZ66947.1 hypothetical protein NOC27_274 [Nitrosococcus oceani AFC27]KFI21870.1 hypothetical protein HW44_12810 [Nitrosococcus oceani]GEM18951.1 hypothetical protein NONS58_03160 [Nitrosococcus oceani]